MIKNITYYRKAFFIIFLPLLILSPFYLTAQSVKRQCISSYGAIYTSNNVTFEQTIGQPYITSSSYETNVSILQGFQQPALFKVEPTNSLLLKTFDLTVYPNPAAYSVTILSNKLIEKSIICVTDLTGKVLMSDHAEDFQTYTINCETWISGVYIITVTDMNQNICSLKLTINK